MLQPLMLRLIRKAAGTAYGTPQPDPLCPAALFHENFPSCRLFTTLFRIMIPDYRDYVAGPTFCGIASEFAPVRKQTNTYSDGTQTKYIFLRLPFTKTSVLQLTSRGTHLKSAPFPVLLTNSVIKFKLNLSKSARHSLCRNQTPRGGDAGPDGTPGAPARACGRTLAGRRRHAEIRHHRRVADHPRHRDCAILAPRDLAAAGGRRCLQTQHPHPGRQHLRACMSSVPRGFPRGLFGLSFHLRARAALALRKLLADVENSRRAPWNLPSVVCASPRSRTGTGAARQAGKLLAVGVQGQGVGCRGGPSRAAQMRLDCIARCCRVYAQARCVTQHLTSYRGAGDAVITSCAHQSSRRPGSPPAIR